MLAAQEALELGGQLVAGRQVAEGRAGQPLLAVLLGLQLADQGGVLLAAGDQLARSAGGSPPPRACRAEVSSSSSAIRASPSSRAADAAG